MVRAKVIIPKTTATERQARHAVMKALDKSAKQTRQRVLDKVADWKQKPDFTISGQGAERTVETENPVFWWQDQGTDPFVVQPPINPRTKRALAFQYHGNPVVVRRITRPIHNPGITGEHWTDSVAEDMERVMPDIFNDAFAEELR